VTKGGGENFWATSLTKKIIDVVGGSIKKKDVEGYLTSWGPRYRKSQGGKATEKKRVRGGGKSNLTDLGMVLSLQDARSVSWDKKRKTPCPHEKVEEKTNVKQLSRKRGEEFAD